MKGIPVLQSKLTMPLVSPSLTFSERRLKICREMSGRHGVFITAPAGYGKTTLLLTAMDEYKSQGCRVSWYRMDKDDQDLAVFYAHLVQMLFPEDMTGQKIHDHLLDPGDVFSRHQYLNTLICRELWTLRSTYPERNTFLVFDDFHQVRDIPEISSAIGYLMDNLPEGFTVVVCSRFDTGLLTGKRRLEKNMLEIKVRDLCFSREETAALIRKRCGLMPGPELLGKIMERTEGWPAGIILLCQMPDSEKILDNTLEHPGRKELLFQYILSEVFMPADEQLLGFLAKLAILPEFTAPQAAALFSEEKASVILENCHQRGFFIQKIAAPDPIYRFHSLFREALQQIQPQFLTAEEVKNYHLKAAVYYIEHRIFDRAIEHFITCGNVDLAVELITRESVNLLAFEALEQFRLWFKLLPEEVVSNNGYLLYIKSFITLHKRPGDALPLLERSLEIFRQADDPIMQVYILISMSQSYLERNNIKGLRWIQEQASMLSEGKQGQPVEWMLAVLDFTLAVWEEKFSKAISRLHFLKSIELVDEWQYLLLFYSSQTYCFMGELNLAESHIREALDLNIVKQAELLRGYILLGCSMVLLMQDKQDIQPKIMDEMMTLAEKHDYKYLLGHGKRMAAFTGYRNHDPEEALKLLEESSGFFETIGNIPMMAANSLYRCLWLCQSSGAKENFLLEAQRALKDLMAEPSGMCLQEIGLSLFGAVAREAGEYQLADESLTVALEKSKTKGTAQVTASVLLHLAKLRYDTGRHQEGAAFLRQALDTAKDYQYVMFWDLHFPTLVEISARCLQVGLHGDWARSLVERYFGGDAAEYLAMEAVLVKKDHFQELTAAFLYRYGGDHETHLAKIYFSLFGRFSMTVDGVIVPESEWKTKKIAGVLKFLLVHRNRLVSKDQLMEVFWPGVDKKLASTSLRAALYELKKVLRKYGLSTEGQMSLLNENRNSLGIYAGNAITVDVDLFLAHSEELKKLPEKDLEREKESLEMLVSLYQGDLLEEEIYEDWTFTEREGLRSIYFRAATDLSGIYVMNNEGNKAEKLLLKILSIDRYNEEACLRLLKLYISNNQRGRAVKLCNNFAGRFEKDLGIKPDKKLLHAIQEHG